MRVLADPGGTRRDFVGFTKSGWGVGVRWARKILKLMLFRDLEHLFPWLLNHIVVVQKSMLFFPSIVIRATCSWMKSCLWITRFWPITVNELPSVDSCSSPKLWGLLVFLTLEIVLHCDPGPKEVVVPPQAIFANLPAGSKACTCVFNCIHPQMMPCHTDVALVCSWSCNCEKSAAAATAMFSRWRAEWNANVQNVALLARDSAISCHTRGESVVHCHSAPLSESGVRLLSVHVVAQWISERSSRLLRRYCQRVSLVLSLDYKDLQFPDNVSGWRFVHSSPTSSWRRTTTMSINLGSRGPFTDSFPVSDRC